MGVLNGRDYLASLNDDRDIRIDGERVSDVVSDPRFAGGAQTIAELYDMQHDPAHADTLTYGSPTSGEKVGLSFIEPKSEADLRARRDMVKTWMDHTCGMLGRSMDFMNVLLTGMASASDSFNRGDRPYGEYLRKYYEHVRENDLALTHTLVNPQVDRSRPVEEQTNDIAARVVEETSEGIIVRGARMVTTLCAYSHEIMFAPSTYLQETEEAKPYAITFSIPVATEGLRFVCRPSLAPQGAASAMDHPLASRFDEGDGVVIFDDVLVPWERVFVYRDVQFTNGLFNRTGTMQQVMHQFSTKNLAKAEFMMGLGFAMARQSNIDVHQHVQEKLAEMINIVEMVRACIRASEADFKPLNGDIVIPEWMPLWTVRQMFPQMFHRMCEIIQLLGAGGIVAVPSFSELESDISEQAETYFQAANADARQRIRLMRLAYDAAVSGFSGRQQLYERFYSGDPVRLAGALYGLYDKDPYVDRIEGMLDELERRERGGGFAPREAAE